MNPELDVRAAELGERYGYHMPVARLLALGEPGEDSPDRWVTAGELGIEREHVPEVIRVLLDERWNAQGEDATEMYAGIHAWRVLGDLRADEAIPALIEVLARSDEEWDDWATEEIPIALGMIGPAAIPTLEQYLQGCSGERYSCSDVAQALVEIAERHHETRDRIVRILTSKLERHSEQAPWLNGELVAYLLDLEAIEAAPLMEAAFAAGDVDLSIAGDWEDVAIELGLLTERSTLRPDLFRALREELSSELESSMREPRAPAQRKAKPKKKARRKQAEQTRKKARQRKKR